MRNVRREETAYLGTDQAAPREMAWGYQDVRADLGYRADYATWNDGRQRNYEVGRMMAAEIKGAGLTLPTWPNPNWLPRLVHVAWFKAGAAQYEPLEIAPPDETLEARALFTRRGMPLPVPEGAKPNG